MLKALKYAFDPAELAFAQFKPCVFAPAMLDPTYFGNAGSSPLNPSWNGTLNFNTFDISNPLKDDPDTDAPPAYPVVLLSTADPLGWKKQLSRLKLTLLPADDALGSGLV